MSEEIDVEQNTLSRTVFFLAGLALLVGGLLIIGHLLTNVEGGVVYIFILFLPAPMVVFGISAIYSSLSDDKTTKHSDTFTENLSNTTELESSNNDSSHPKTVNQETEILKQQGRDDVGTHLTTLFFTFGAVIFILVLIGSTVMDINNGVTEVCGRRSSCHKVYFKDSALHFYISLALGKSYWLIFTALLGFFAFKRLKE